MRFIVDLTVAVLFLLGSGYVAQETLLFVKKATIERIDKGLSPSEPFAQALTGEKLPF